MRPWLKSFLAHLRSATGSAKIQRTPQQQIAADRAARKLTLYHFSGCPYCSRTRRAIERLGITIPLRDIHRDAQAHAELVAGGGRQTVPCLRIDDDGPSRWLYESGDIIRYLQRRFTPDKHAP